MSANILIVEDEIVVARDLQMRLQHLGYRVAGVTGNAREAVEHSMSQAPDLILMDIHLLPGKPDGIDAARQITERLDVPIIYVTAFTDDRTLFRARETNPYGYVVKPIQTRELQIALDLALHKHAAERRLRESLRWLGSVLRSMGDGVIAADHGARIDFMNPVAERLTGWKEADARGRPFRSVLNIQLADALERRSGAEGAEFLPLGFLGQARLTTKDGAAREIELVVSKLVREDNVECGEVVVFQDSSLRDIRSVRRRG
ncbi:MAG: response regulator [Spirochaetia bacterium]|nr:response regulator [Spirochaetia bacterium]